MVSSLDLYWFWQLGSRMDCAGISEAPRTRKSNTIVAANLYTGQYERDHQPNISSLRNMGILNSATPLSLNSTAIKAGPYKPSHRVILETRMRVGQVEDPGGSIGVSSGAGCVSMVC